MKMSMQVPETTPKRHEVFLSRRCLARYLRRRKADGSLRHLKLVVVCRLTLSVSVLEWPVATSLRLGASHQYNSYAVIALFSEGLRTQLAFEIARTTRRIVLKMQTRGLPSDSVQGASTDRSGGTVAVQQLMQ